MVVQNLLDSADFIELLLKHLIRSNDVLQRAREVGLLASDFATSEHGIQVYKIMADIALGIGQGPIDQLLLATHLKHKLESGELHSHLLDGASALLYGLYEGGLNPEYFVEQLKPFIKRRRQEQAKVTFVDDNDALAAELSLINISLDKEEIAKSTPIVNPFQTLVKKSLLELIPTGFPRIDATIGGLGYGEYSILLGYSGGGKCHGKDTPILMYDGSIKMVQDIEAGDLLMGNDSTSRRVLSLARGREQMYEIIPTKGDAWTCNGSHILSLVATYPTKPNIQQHDIVNISVNDYMQRSVMQQMALKLYRVGVEFNPSPVGLDPYLLGCWLGDGSRHKPAITSGDEEIVDYLYDWANKDGLKIRYEPGQGCNTYILRANDKGRRNLKNKFTIETRRCINKDKHKFIPSEYLINSRENRLQLLAGLVDTDGHLHNGTFEITTKYKSLRDGILYLARSLGFAANSKDKIAKLKSRNYQCLVYRINISGEISKIPCKLARKQAKRRRQVKSVLRSGFKIKKLVVDDYYGFELEGNHLYLLGDFTVTHNTALSTSIAKNIAINGMQAAYLSLEEDHENICNRFYSQVYRVNYSDLHRGSGQMELEEKFASLEHEEHRQLLANNLKVYGLKEKSPLNTEQIYNLLLQDYEKTGFQPKFVCIDQMSFLEPSDTKKSDQRWELTRKVSDECDQLSHKQIGPGGYFSLMVNHQATGKMKLYFTNDEIADFKGVVRPADSVFGIGKESPSSTKYEIFSLKCRHSGNFKLEYSGRMEYMTLEDPVVGNTTANPIRHYDPKESYIIKTNVDTKTMDLIPQLTGKVVNLPKPSIPVT